VISYILPPVFTLFFPHLDRRLSPQGLDPLKPFQKFILSRSATAPSYNMVWIITSISSIKSNKPSFPTTPCIQCLASLLPLSIAVVSLYSAYLCASVCVCFVCVLLLFFFSHCRIHLFSCLAASLFNKLRALITQLICLPVFLLLFTAYVSLISASMANQDYTHWTIKKRDISFLTITLANLNRFL